MRPKTLRDRVAVVDPSLPREGEVDFTVIRATPYDLVVLWSQDGTSEQDRDSLQYMAEGLAESTGAVMAIIPANIVTDVTSHGLLDLIQLRDELDAAIQQLSAEQSQGEA